MTHTLSELDAFATELDEASYYGTQWDELMEARFKKAASLLREQAGEIEALRAECVDKAAAWDETSKKNEVIKAQAARIEELERGLKRCDALAIAALINTTPERSQVIQDALDDVLGIARALLSPEAEGKS
jgi:hypothetical protein